MTVTVAARDDLAAGALRPEQILAGSPRTRQLTLAESADAGFAAALWECTPGSFRWDFHSDEVVHILEGEVEITDHTGLRATLRPGSVAYFAAGSHAIWTVTRTLKKLAVFRSPPPSLPRQVLEAVKSATGAAKVFALTGGGLQLAELAAYV